MRQSTGTLVVGWCGVCAFRPTARACRGRELEAPVRAGPPSAGSACAPQEKGGLPQAPGVSFALPPADTARDAGLWQEPGLRQGRALAQQERRACRRPAPAHGLRRPVRLGSWVGAWGSWAAGETPQKESPVSAAACCSPRPPALPCPCCHTLDLGLESAAGPQSPAHAYRRRRRPPPSPARPPAPSLPALQGEQCGGQAAQPPLRGALPGLLHDLPPRDGCVECF